MKKKFGIVFISTAFLFIVSTLFVNAGTIILESYAIRFQTATGGPITLNNGELEYSTNYDPNFISTGSGNYYERVYADVSKIKGDSVEVILYEEKAGEDLKVGIATIQDEQPGKYKLKDYYDESKDAQMMQERDFYFTVENDDDSILIDFFFFKGSDTEVQLKVYGEHTLHY